MHIPEIRFYEVALSGANLSDHEFHHLRECPQCVEALADVTREVIAKRARTTNADGKTTENNGNTD
jgi:hypothetical protein